MWHKKFKLGKKSGEKPSEVNNFEFDNSKNIGMGKPNISSKIIKSQPSFFLLHT